MNPHACGGTNAQPLAVALVGAILPDHAMPDFPAANPPGNAFQCGVLNALLAQRIDTSVISLRPVSSYPRSPKLLFRRVDDAFRKGVPCRQIGFVNAGPLKTLTAAFTTFVALLRWTRRHRGERRVMLFYNAYNPSAWVGILAARLTRSMVVVIAADVRVPGSGGGEASLLRRMEYHIAVASLKRVDAIVPVTRAIARDFAHGVPVIFVEGGIADDMLAPLPASPIPTPRGVACSEQGPSSNRFVIMYSGSLTPLGGVPLLLEAFKRLQQSNFRLWITGDGELEAVVREATANDARILYFGMLPREDLLAKYAAADVLVNPHSTTLLTARYVFPSKLLEFLASGRPVITTATPEIAAGFGAYCTVLKCEEPQALADAIMRVAGMPVVDRLARALESRAAVIDRYGWSRQGPRLVQFVEEQSNLYVLGR